MSITLPAFTPIEDTLFLTLCGRALDNRLPHPILGDAMAEEIVKKLDHDSDKFHLSASPIIKHCASREEAGRGGAKFHHSPPERRRVRPRAGLTLRSSVSIRRPLSTGMTSTFLR
jgi:hypothetical protein